MMKRFLTATLFVTTLTSAFAQDIPKKVVDLSWLVGTWSGTGKVTFGGHETSIATTVTLSFDGDFLKAVSTDVGNGYTMTKTSMTGWDAAKNQYVSYTFTNIAPMARIAHGNAESDKLAMVSEPWEAEGMTLVSRETMWKISDTKCGLLLESKKGDKWDKEMDYVLTKK
jgi:hypothetical protein